VVDGKNGYVEFNRVVSIQDMLARIWNNPWYAWVPHLGVVFALVALKFKKNINEKYE
jgi:hypothetical protein